MAAQKKHILEDIKPVPKRSVRQIEKAAGPRLGAAPRPPVRPDPETLPFTPIETPPQSHNGLWYVAVIVILAFLFSLSFLFERAEVKVTPKTETVAFDSSDTFTAQKDSADPSAIVYTEMTLSGDESIKVPSTSSKDQSLPATGKVVLYNAYSPAPYKLVKSTRLSTPDGKIYRID